MWLKAHRNQRINLKKRTHPKECQQRPRSLYNEDTNGKISIHAMRPPSCSQLQNHGRVCTSCRRRGSAWQKLAHSGPAWQWRQGSGPQADTSETEVTTRKGPQNRPSPQGTKLRTLSVATGKETTACCAPPRYSTK